VVLAGALFAVALSASDIVTFPDGNLTLEGVLFEPGGSGPFPAVIYHHGSAAGVLSQQAFDALGPAISVRPSGRRRVPVPHS
jgi:hypothetical protein